MANSNQTHVEILEKLSVRKSMQNPNYSMIYSKEGTHNNIFHIKVIAGGGNVIPYVESIGISTSKQRAKQKAAEEALIKLERLDIYHPGERVEPKASLEVPEGSINIPTNAITKLHKLCKVNKIMVPKFTETSDGGPDHCKTFTYKCEVLSLVTTSTGRKKQLAKQMAAHEMLNMITPLLAELVVESNRNSSQQGITEDREALKKFEELRRRKPQPHLNVPFGDRDLLVKIELEKKHITKADLLMYKNSECPEEAWKELMCKLELNYHMELFQSSPLLVVLSVAIDMPFTLVDRGETYEEAAKKEQRTSTVGLGNKAAYTAVAGESYKDCVKKMMYARYQELTDKLD